MAHSADNSEGNIHERVQGALLEIIIDRPAKLNGFTPKMIADYSWAITRYEQNDSLRCAVVRAEGANFTAGLDLPRIAEYWRRGEDVYPRDALDMWDLRPPFRKKPLIFAVNGICFTVGVELMLTADIVIAAANCRFSQMEVKRGIMATGGGTIRIVQRAGWANAMRYLLTGEEWNAEAALRMNLVQEIVPAGEERARAFELADAICRNAAPLAVIETRRNARAALEHGPAAAVGQFDEIRWKLRATEDSAEGVRSFAEKRPPVFVGR